MRAWRLAAGLLWIGFGAGCGRAGPDLSGVHDRHGGTLRLAAVDDIRTLDTAIGYDVPSWRFERLIYEGLLDYASDSTLVPAIADDLPRIVGGRKFIFKLRHGVHFQSGREVVAGDFKYAIERVLRPETASPASGFFEPIVGAPEFVAGRADEVRGITCPDPHTLAIELVEPDVSFLNVLAMPFAYALPKELVERWTDPATGETSWPEHAVGAGPYRLEEWSRGFRIRVRRWDGYYRPGRGFVDVVEQRFGIPDYMQLMMFERGELDATDIPLPDHQRVINSPALQPLLRSMPENAINYCSMNCEVPPFTDRRVRQAFNCAVDKERLQRILSGTATPAKGVLPPGMPGYNPELRGYPHDPARAKELLAEAGYGDGLQVEMLTRARPAEQRWVEAVQEDLANVGVKVVIRSVSFPQWLDLTGKRGEVAFTVNAWYQDYPDPSNFLEVLLSGDRITARNCPNRAFYNNPEVTRLLRRAHAMTDLEARLRLYQQIEQMVVDDAPWIFLYHPTAYRLVQPWVHNFELHPVWLTTEAQVWLGPPGPEEAN